MSHKHKQIVKEIEKPRKNESCKDNRAAHWEKLVIYGHCNKCNRVFSL